MSVIIALKENGVIYFGADTQATTSSSEKSLAMNDVKFKVQRFDNGILAGFCGSAGSIDKIVLKNIFSTDENGNLTKKHLVTETVPKLAAMLDEIQDEDDEDSMNISIILAHGANLYKIEPNLVVYKINEYTKSGSGSPYVDYAIDHYRDLPVKERLIKALTESARRDPYVSGPFVLIDTKVLKYEIIDLGGENF